ncbi:hypothetical protein [Paraburkholderia lycopersici]|uniref:hypothetical protein n=1 Tax=Paraburkholderia lycopersici TaxID=416944 RepID=UPI001C409B30|nr:hypothetical protein [Paraburkholderia lycopersici]
MSVTQRRVGVTRRVAADASKGAAFAAAAVEPVAAIREAPRAVPGMPIHIA